MEDTAKEGDICRVIPNLAHNISSPLNNLRSFVNVKGGTCNNVWADLVHVHNVRQQRDLIKQLGANKSNDAISRTTSACNILASIYWPETDNRIETSTDGRVCLAALMPQYIAYKTVPQKITLKNQTLQQKYWYPKETDNKASCSKRQFMYKF
ncbi:unnamed protein product [Mytilus edulis]|uniref:Uncharacterized protein n=1 Tax=Mytilus edulis TaxID=6550 RepID=A0A8S3THZ5_MYTED|nr:unnamed protein product [Mytilus edulis]